MVKFQIKSKSMNRIPGVERLTAVSPVFGHRRMILSLRLTSLSHMERAKVCVAVLLVVAGGTVTTAAGTGGSAGAADATPELVTLTMAVQTPAGEPIGGATVRISYEGGSNRTKTFSNGKALVDVPRGADVSINISHSKYVINHPVEVTGVGPSETVQITMYQRANAIVEVSDGSASLKDARVTLTKTSTGRVAAEGYTGNDGIFQTQDIEAGRYLVTAVKRGFEKTSRTVEVTPPNTGTTITLSEATAEVVVTVKDDHFRTPQPIADATVEIRYQGEVLVSGKTGGSGKRGLPVGVNGQYTVRVTKEGYQVAEQTFYLAESDRSFEFTINRERRLDLSAVNERVLAGESVLVRVRNAYGEPVQGALIRRNGTNVGTTDGSGELKVTIPETGTYRIVASTEGVSSNAVTVRGVEAAKPTETATPTPTATATQTPTPTPGETTSSEPLPGFTAVVTLAGILAALGALARRRD